jgi:hypothetical protein
MNNAQATKPINNTSQATGAKIKNIFVYKTHELIED